MFWKALLPKPGAALREKLLANDPNIIDAPVSSIFLASTFTMLSEALGLRRSAETNESRLGDGTPIPMMSYALYEYLRGLDLSGFDVLELGSGLSTDFWVASARSVVALETNPAWAQATAQRNPSARVEHVTKPVHECVAELDGKFDIIVVDPAANRVACSRAALAKIRAGGFIILDNSDWYPNSSRILRDAGLIEIDFHDFRPCHHFRATSSLYLTPEFRPKPKFPRLPIPPIGGKDLPNNGWDAE